MNIKEAKAEIQNTVRAYTRKDEQGQYQMAPVRQRPILLIGPPGIGKTAIMEQVAKECGIGLVSYTITHHTRQSAVGLPVVVHKNYQGKEYTVTEYTMSEIIASVYECMERTGCREGILFIDEINCVSETLTPTMLQFLQCKMFGTHAVPKGWVIVAAGNPAAYNKSAREFDIVTLDRVKRIEVEADVEVWKEYAYEKHLHPAILSYLNLKKANFYYVNTEERKKAFVTARGWEDLSAILQSYEQMEIAVNEALVYQYIQEQEIACDFADYYQLYAKYGADYQVDQILDGRMEEKEYESRVSLAKNAARDERITVASLIVNGLSEDFRAYAEMTEKVSGLYDLLQQVKRELTSGDSMAVCIERRKHAAQMKKENQLWSVLEEKRMGQQIRFLEQCELDACKERAADAEKVFDVLRRAMNNLCKKREDFVENLQKRIHRGFLFLEDAFGEGTELTWFMGELSQNANAMEFISTFGNQEYFAHSGALKVSKKRRELLEKIERIMHE